MYNSHVFLCQIDNLSQKQIDIMDVIELKHHRSVIGFSRWGGKKKNKKKKYVFSILTKSK